MVTFFTPGVPRPQGSKRAYVNRKTGRPIIVDQGGRNLGDWRGDVQRSAIAAQVGAPLEGPVAVTLIFYLPRPKSHPKTKVTYPVTRPDVDKLARAVLDAITHVCFKDDSQITHLTAEKVWATEQAPVGCQVWVGPAFNRGGIVPQGKFLVRESGPEIFVPLPDPRWPEL